MNKINGYYPIVESDISFSTNYAWGTDGYSGKKDFQSVVLHELGHTVGLGDLYNNAAYKSDTKQIMNSYHGVQKILGNGDANGVWKLYG